MDQVIEIQIRYCLDGEERDLPKIIQFGWPVAVASIQSQTEHLENMGALVLSVEMKAR